MSNFKLTDENKQTLIMALTFSDDKIVEQSKDALIRKIKDGKINTAYELTPYSYHIKTSIDSHKAMLKRIIDDELVLYVRLSVLFYVYFTVFSGCWAVFFYFRRCFHDGY